MRSALAASMTCAVIAPDCPVWDGYASAERQMWSLVDERVVFADEQFAPGKVEEPPLVFEQRRGGGLALGSRGGSAELRLVVEPYERDAVPGVRRAAARCRDGGADGRVRRMELHVAADAEH